jgi:hypothetical protein
VLSKGKKKKKKKKEGCKGKKKKQKKKTIGRLCFGVVVRKTKDDRDTAA